MEHGFSGLNRFSRILRHERERSAPMVRVGARESDGSGRAVFSMPELVEGEKNGAGADSATAVAKRTYGARSAAGGSPKTSKKGR